MIENLIHQFILAKDNKPSNVNDLLDFIQKAYVEEKISILDYRNLFRELTVLGAVKPFYEEDINFKTESILSN